MRIEDTKLEELTECCPLEVTLDDGAPLLAGDVGDKELEETHDDDHPIELGNCEGNELDRLLTVVMEEDRVLEATLDKGVEKEDKTPEDTLETAV